MRRSFFRMLVFARTHVAFAAARPGSAASMPRRVARLATLAALLFVATLAALLPVTAGAVDGTGDKIYWGAESGGTIQVANLDGSGTASTLFGAEGGPCGVAIDPATGKIYWANFYSNGIRVTNLDGSGIASTLFDGGEN